jgi:hypothetical protein
MILCERNFLTTLFMSSYIFTSMLTHMLWFRRFDLDFWQTANLFYLRLEGGALIREGALNRGNTVYIYIYIYISHITYWMWRTRWCTIDCSHYPASVRLIRQMVQYQINTLHKLELYWFYSGTYFIVRTAKLLFDSSVRFVFLTFEYTHKRFPRELHIFQACRWFELCYFTLY